MVKFYDFVKKISEAPSKSAEDRIVRDEITFLKHAMSSPKVDKVPPTIFTLYRKL